MAALSETMRRTSSVCPVCLKRIPAVRTERDGEIFLEKTCPEHGSFSSVIWRNRVDFGKWRGQRPAAGAQEGLKCPSGCGLCADHLRGTCCTLLEITDRCNMNCTFCFAEPDGGRDPELETVKAWIDGLVDPGKTLLQLSGGEPTVRDDLPEIVAYAKAAGCKYVQLNSNGLRLAEEPEFVKRLADAGLSFVFMQFDGVDDGVYEKLRRRPMLDIKKRAIENCGRLGIGVTLVPVIVPGVNDRQIGDILRFAVERSPLVRGVHFQPVSYFGRVPEPPEDKDRYTLDQLMEAVVKQSGGLIQMENIAPSCCDHPMCGFHGDFIVMPDRTLMPLTSFDGEAKAAENDCCCGADPAEKNREFVGRRWERRDLEALRAAAGVESCCCGDSGAGETAESALDSCCCGTGVEADESASESCCCGGSGAGETAGAASESCCCGDSGAGETAEPASESCCCGGDSGAGETAESASENCCCGAPADDGDVDMTSMAGFLKRAKSHGFTVTSMAFQDAGNLDIERLRQCSLHVYRDGRFVPFCAYYLSSMGMPGERE